MSLNKILLVLAFTAICFSSKIEELEFGKIIDEYQVPKQFSELRNIQAKVLLNIFMQQTDIQGQFGLNTMFSQKSGFLYFILNDVRRYHILVDSLFVLFNPDEHGNTNKENMKIFFNSVLKGQKKLASFETDFFKNLNAYQQKHGDVTSVISSKQFHAFFESLRQQLVSLVNSKSLKPAKLAQIPELRVIFISFIRNRIQFGYYQKYLLKKYIQSHAQVFNLLFFRIFHFFDDNGDRFVTVDEVVTTLNKVNASLGKRRVTRLVIKQIQKVFQQLDFNKDGKVSYQEITAVLPYVRAILRIRE